MFECLLALLPFVLGLPLFLVIDLECLPGHDRKAWSDIVASSGYPREGVVCRRRSANGTDQVFGLVCEQERYLILDADGRKPGPVGSPELLAFFD